MVPPTYHQLFRAGETPAPQQTQPQKAGQPGPSLRGGRLVVSWCSKSGPSNANKAPIRRKEKPGTRTRSESKSKGHKRRQTNSPANKTTELASRRQKRKQPRRPKRPQPSEGKIERRPTTSPRSAQAEEEANAEPSGNTSGKTRTGARTRPLKVKYHPKSNEINHATQKQASGAEEELRTECNLERKHPQVTERA